MSQPENFEIIRGESLFDSDAAVLVNPINTVGVMGAGLAKDFAKRYGDDYLDDYKRACDAQELSARHGKGHWWSAPDGKIICGLPTKEHWRQPSEYEYVFHGLWELGHICDNENLDSVALPALGCGLGALEVEAVTCLIAWAAAVFPDTTWKLYLP